MEGILPVYKPVGMSSYDVIREWKKLGTRQKIGHGGTLDPFAEGVLLLLVGRSATKKMDELGKLKKTYVAKAVVGASSDTLDCTGELRVSKGQSPRVSEDQIKAILPKFLGEIEQKIPDYSAAKVDGKPRYLLARQGALLAAKSKKVTIDALTVVKIDEVTYQLTTTVSSGTYIRQLSYDIFKSLGVESYLTKLVRTKIGDYDLKRCVSVADMQAGKWEEYLSATSNPAK